jgi:cell division protein FtsX
MGKITGYIGELFAALVQGCLVMAVTAAIVATGAYYLAHQRMPQGFDVGLILVIVVLAGVIGALVMLVWRLTHLRELARVASHVANAAQQTPKDPFK